MIEVRTQSEFNRALKSHPGDIIACIGSGNPDPECGGGLHFSPSPGHALHFHEGPRFVACPVKVSEIIFHRNGVYPQKVKAPRVVGKGCVEVDIHGEPVGQ